MTSRNKRNHRYFGSNAKPINMTNCNENEVNHDAGNQSNVPDNEEAISFEIFGRKVLEKAFDNPEAVMIMLEILADLPGLPDEFKTDLNNLGEQLSIMKNRKDRSEELNKETTIEEEKMTTTKETIKDAKKELTQVNENISWIPTTLAVVTAVGATGFDMLVNADLSKERIIGTAAAGILAGAAQQVVQRTMTSGQSDVVNSAIGVGLGLGCAAGARFGINYFAGEEAAEQSYEV